MRWIVSWEKAEGLEGKEVEVEGEDRWAAVVNASKKLGIETVAPMQQLFNAASVRKVKTKKVKEMRFEGRLSIGEGFGKK
jgi:hypothetical protein